MGIEKQFEAFAKFGDVKSDGRTITLTNSDKWMKQAGVFDKKISTIDTGICFGKFKAKTITFDQYERFLEDLSQYRGVPLSEIRAKLANCAEPGLTGATDAANMDVVARLTDTSRYTGAHKQRFDESGRGRGKAGREDAVSPTGYVQGYKHAGTYDSRSNRSDKNGGL